MSQAVYMPYSATGDALTITVYHVGANQVDDARSAWDFDAVDANGVTIGARYGFRTRRDAESAAVAEYGARVAGVVYAPGCRCIGCEVTA